MKIAFVTTYGVKCGIATYTEHLAEEVCKENEVAVFAEDYLNNAQPDFKTNLRLFRCFNRNLADTRLIKALSLYDPDIIHIQHEYGIFKNLTNMLRKMRERFDGRVVMTLHTVKTNCDFDLEGCADHFIVHKEQAREHLIKCGLEPERVSVIPHGTLIVPKIPSRIARWKLNLPMDKKIILSHSFFERRKNIDKIIKAVAKLRNEFSIYYIHLGGLHPQVIPENGQRYFEECLQLIENLNISSNVRFISRFISEEELVYFLNACDLIVTIENSSYPNISASGIMHTVARKPVIASDVVNFSEFPPGSFYRINVEEESLTSAIRDVLLNRELSDMFIANLMKYAEETSWSRIAEEHLKIYEECIPLKYIYA